MADTPKKEEQDTRGVVEKTAVAITASPLKIIDGFKDLWRAGVSLTTGAEFHESTMFEDATTVKAARLPSLIGQGVEQAVVGTMTLPARAADLGVNGFRLAREKMGGEAYQSSDIAEQAHAYVTTSLHGVYSVDTPTTTGEHAFVDGTSIIATTVGPMALGKAGALVREGVAARTAAGTNTTTAATNTTANAAANTAAHAHAPAPAPAAAAATPAPAATVNATNAGTNAAANAAAHAPAPGPVAAAAGTPAPAAAGAGQMGPGAGAAARAGTGQTAAGATNTAGTGAAANPAATAGAAAHTPGAGPAAPGATTGGTAAGANAAGTGTANAANAATGAANAAAAGANATAQAAKPGFFRAFNNAFIGLKARYEAPLSGLAGDLGVVAKANAGKSEKEIAEAMTPIVAKYRRVGKVSREEAQEVRNSADIPKAIKDRVTTISARHELNKAESTVVGRWFEKRFASKWDYWANYNVLGAPGALMSPISAGLDVVKLAHAPLLMPLKATKYAFSSPGHFIGTAAAGTVAVGTFGAVNNATNGAAASAVGQAAHWYGSNLWTMDTAIVGGTLAATGFAADKGVQFYNSEAGAATGAAAKKFGSFSLDSIGHGIAATANAAQSAVTGKSTASRPSAGNTGDRAAAPESGDSAGIGATIGNAAGAAVAGATALAKGVANSKTPGQALDAAKQAGAAAVNHMNGPGGQGAADDNDEGFNLGGMMDGPGPQSLGELLPWMKSKTTNPMLRSMIEQAERNPITAGAMTLGILGGLWQGDGIKGKAIMAIKGAAFWGGIGMIIEALMGKDNLISKAFGWVFGTNRPGQDHGPGHVPYSIQREREEDYARRQAQGQPNGYGYDPAFAQQRLQQQPYSGQPGPGRPGPYSPQPQQYYDAPGAAPRLYGQPPQPPADQQQMLNAPLKAEPGTNKDVYGRQVTPAPANNPMQRLQSQLQYYDTNNPPVVAAAAKPAVNQPQYFIPSYG